MEVKAERTGWRDLGLSERHRHWGWDCPAVDLDFLFLEYDKGKAVAIVEYKNEHAPVQYASHPTYQAIIDLGTRAGIPVFACRYSSDYSWWKPIALNIKAKVFLPEILTMNEAEWVKFLYHIRGYDCPQTILDGLMIQI